MSAEDGRAGRVIGGAHFGRIPESLLLDPGVSAEACRLYALLTTYDYRRTGQCRPGDRELGERLGKSERSIYNLKKALENAGALEQRRRGQGHANDLVLLADFEPIPDRKETSELDRNPDRKSAGIHPLTNENNEIARPRARNPIFDALVALFGDASTDTRGSFYGKIAAELKRAGATPEQIEERGRRLLGKGWPDAGPGALVKHWDELAQARQADPTGLNAGRE